MRIKIFGAITAATLFFTGCAGLLPSPEEERQMLSSFSEDRYLGTAMSPLIGQDYSLMSLSLGSNKLIVFSKWNTVKFADQVKGGAAMGLLAQRVEESQIVKTYIDAGKKRGNNVVTFKNNLNSAILLHGAGFTSAYQGHNTKNLYNAAPCYMEFDANGRIVSSLAHYHEMFYRFNNVSPYSDVSINSTYYIIPGYRAKNIQNRLGQKAIDEAKLY